MWMTPHLVYSVLVALMNAWTSKAAPVSSDPCAAIAGNMFVSVAEAVACQKSFPFNETLRQNVLSVVSGVFDFYTFESYYLDSPAPFQASTANIRQELARINTTQYATDYDFNQDLYNFVNQLNDGHTLWQPNCYVSWENILPTAPVSLSVNGTESVYIAPDMVAFVELIPEGFSEFLQSVEVDWQRLAGARVLQIEGMDPYDYADHIADTVTGNYLDHNVRINSVWTGYRLSGSSFSQKFGDIAGQLFSSRENVTFALLPVNSTEQETVTVPYVATFMGNSFTDQASYWENNCAANSGTNGVDRRLVSALLNSHKRGPARAAARPPAGAIGLPLQFQPSLPPVSSNADVIASYILNDSQTGVMFVGSFDDNDLTHFQSDVRAAIRAFQTANVNRLIIDLTDNIGGIVCLGIFLHGYLAGSSFGYPGFQSDIRATPFAQRIVQANIQQSLTFEQTFYAPDNCKTFIGVIIRAEVNVYIDGFLNDTQLTTNFNFINPSVPLTINGVSDPTSQRLHDSCTFSVPFPDSPPFDFNNIVIVSNGNCASTCAHFSTLMSERHNVTTVVFGGRADQPIEFKGMAGQQVLEWTDLDSEIKTAGLKDDPAAPPDLLVSANMRHNWRTAYSFEDESQPIEYRSEPPRLRFPYTSDTYNNPQNVWQFV
ncbi:hypothetical protein EWM64_g6268, partial [Hericium alpestre]